MNQGAPAAITTRSGWARSKMRSAGEVRQRLVDDVGQSGIERGHGGQLASPSTQPAHRDGIGGGDVAGKGQAGRHVVDHRFDGEADRPLRAGRHEQVPHQRPCGRVGRSGRGRGVDPGQRAGRLPRRDRPPSCRRPRAAARARPGRPSRRTRGRSRRRGRSGASIGARRPTGSARARPGEAHRRPTARMVTTPGCRESWPSCTRPTITADSGVGAVEASTSMGPSTSETSRRERWRRSSWTSPWVGAHICPRLVADRERAPVHEHQLVAGHGGTAFGVGVERIGHLSKVWLLNRPSAGYGTGDERRRKRAEQRVRRHLPRVRGRHGAVSVGRGTVPGVRDAGTSFASATSYRSAPTSLDAPARTGTTSR